MIEHLAPAVYILFAWWISTVLILYLDGLPRWTYKFTFGAITALAAIALCGLAETADDTRLTGAYLAFTSALVVWAWQETAFLMGFITGPRRLPCPPGSRGFTRLRHALAAILYHELAMIGVGALVLWITWGADNPVGAWTYLSLWVLRLSTQVQVFLGARNLNESFLPEHLRYLGSYFRKRPMNALFPPAMLACVAATWWAWSIALSPDLARHEAVAWTFLATMLALGVIEHALLMVPLPGEWLWSLGLRSREPAPAVKP